MAEYEYPSAKNAAVVHNASKQRFEINIDGQLSVLEYTFKNHRLFLTHTEVPPALESQGLGTALAHAALEYALWCAKTPSDGFVIRCDIVTPQ